MLDKKLLSSKEDDAVRAVARTVTLTALRRLDGERKAEVVHFLNEANLHQSAGCPSRALTAPTSRASTSTGAQLKGANLEGADLRDADPPERRLRGRQPQVRRPQGRRPH